MGFSSYQTTEYCVILINNSCITLLYILQQELTTNSNICTENVTNSNEYGVRITIWMIRMTMCVVNIAVNWFLKCTEIL